jgi:hypothetical protein
MRRPSEVNGPSAILASYGKSRVVGVVTRDAGDGIIEFVPTCLTSLAHLLREGAVGARLGRRARTSAGWRA